LIEKRSTPISKHASLTCTAFSISAVVSHASRVPLARTINLQTLTEDVEALVSGGKYIKALIPAVVNIVYKKLLQYDITARAFTTRSTSFDGPLDEVPDEQSPQILHRKMFLKAYLIKLCSDPTQMEFWEYLDKVG
jgi:hypothetical protein